jgi:uncharacterized membrane protein YphA (DoxX/SURF4 family)
MRRREAAEVVDMNIALWIAQILLALIFIFAGVIKFVTPMEEMLKQMPIALPPAFLIFTGIVEVLGGLGVILPWLLNIRPGLTPFAAVGLVIVMIGAVVYTIAAGDPAPALIPAAVGLLAAFVAWGRWRSKPAGK